MNIAHLLSTGAVFPLSAHHGRYEWVLRLAEAQAAAGHTVTVYCGGGSQPVAHPLSWEHPEYNFGNKTIADMGLLCKAFGNQEHDVFHSHLDFLHYFAAGRTDKPIIFTQHWFPADNVAAAAKLAAAGNVHAVPVTNYMRRKDLELGIASEGPITHGVDLRRFAFSDRPRSDRFIFFGRLNPHKGVREAVGLAKTAGVRLDIVGKVHPADEAYWQTVIPDIDGERIRYLGPKPQAELPELLARARGFLFPVTGIEAFGQTIIEAQACGTPVVTSDIGAARELVRHGITGFLAATPGEFLEGIAKITELSPRDCRNHAEQFDVTIMNQKYEALYKKMLTRQHV